MTSPKFSPNLISKNSSIKEALTALERCKKKILIVIDETEKIVGLLTDGDVRRGLISGALFSDSVEKIMNNKPKLAKEGEDINETINHLKGDLYRHIIIVDNLGKLTNILSIEDLLSPKSNKVAVIMAGGRGKRLGKITDTIPKPMVEISGVPMIERIINQLSIYGYSKFFITVHYKKEIIMDYLKDGSAFGVEIEYIEEDTPLGTAGSLSLLPRNLGSDFLVTNSDLITNVDFLAFENFHYSHNKLATLCVKNFEYQVPYGVIELDENSEINNIVEKPSVSHMISSGMYIFKSDVLQYIPHQKYLDMPELLKLMIKIQEIKVFLLFESWHDVGKIEDLEAVRVKFQASSLQPKLT